DCIAAKYKTHQTDPATAWRRCHGSIPVRSTLIHARPDSHKPSDQRFIVGASGLSKKKLIILKGSETPMKLVITPRFRIQLEKFVWVRPQKTQIPKIPGIAHPAQNRPRSRPFSRMETPVRFSLDPVRIIAAAAGRNKSMVNFVATPSIRNRPASAERQRESFVEATAK